MLNVCWRKVQIINIIKKYSSLKNDPLIVHSIISLQRLLLQYNSIQLLKSTLYFTLPRVHLFSWQFHQGPGFAFLCNSLGV